MTPRTVFAFWIIALTLFGTSADAAPIDSLRQFLTGTSTLQANFTQVIYDAEGVPGQKSSGKFYLQRPGKFRWDYESPYRQLVVSAHDRVWFYDADLAQVTTKRLNDAIGSTPALLLSGNVPLEDNFTIEADGMDEGLEWVRLRPRSEEAGFQYVLIGLNAGQLAGMELRDAFGSLTRIYFAELKAGGKLDAALFRFSPPPGVDVFEGD